MIVITLGLGILIPRPFFVSDVEQGSVPVSETPAGTRTVLLLSSAIHTDLALPADPDVAERFGFMAPGGLDPAQPAVAYIIAGWGGRSFYIETPTWADLKPGPVFSALTIDRSVMHLGLAGEIDLAHPTVTAIQLDEASFELLLQSVLASFTLTADGRPIGIPGAEYGEYDRFYEAEGSFNALAGCNIWTSRMLRQAGLQTGLWTPLPRLLGLSLKLHNPESRFVYNPADR